MLTLQTPSGDIIKDSSSYEDNNYLLLLPNPVQSGKYSCEVPQLYADEACLGADSHHKNKASVVVDGVCNSSLACLHLHVSVQSVVVVGYSNCFVTVDLIVYIYQFSQLTSQLAACLQAVS